MVNTSINSQINPQMNSLNENEKNTNLESLLNQLKFNPYVDSKECFDGLSTQAQTHLLESLYAIFLQKSIVFSKFVKCHPHFENYIFAKNLDSYNLTFLENNMRLMYAIMQLPQVFLPNIIFFDILDSKKILCVIPFEPFSASFKDNLSLKIAQSYSENIEFFICRQDFLDEVRWVLELQSACKSASLDENLLSNLLYLAVKFLASDIHFTLERKIASCLFRIDGSLIHFLELDSNLFLKLSKKLKLLCQIDINDVKEPQDGHFSQDLAQDSKADSKNIESNHKNDIRISFLPTLNGESIVLRIPLKEKRFHNLNDLNISNDILSALQYNLRAKSGLLIISGPTNSAKSTLLYNCLRYLHDGKKKILTIEDPIEQEINGIQQCQINKDENLNFANALKYMLRQDPDIIMIGEIRDKQTLDVAIKAALSGHLVMASLHSSSCESSIDRLRDLGAKRELLDSVLKCVISQRLIKTLCPFCKFLHNGVYVAHGCYKCYNQGYGKRFLIQEMMDFRNALESKNINIESNFIPSPLRESNKIYFSKSLKQKANDLFREGIISYEESLL